MVRLNFLVIAESLYDVYVQCYINSYVYLIVSTCKHTNIHSTFTGKYIRFILIILLFSLKTLWQVPEFIDHELGTKTSIFVKTSPKRSFSYQFVPRDASISMFWKRSDWGVVFKYRNCVEEEISRFSCPKSGHIRWQVFNKFVEFAKVECSVKAYNIL
jgi:ferredoxin-like protein FixX